MKKQVKVTQRHTAWPARGQAPAAAFTDYWIKRGGRNYHARSYDARSKSAELIEYQEQGKWKSFECIPYHDEAFRDAARYLFALGFTHVQLWYRHKRLEVDRRLVQSRG